MDNFSAAAIVASDLTISDKIRALAAAGYPRADIARLLGKRYQHVRNVLEADKLSRGEEAVTGFAEPQRPFRGPLVERDVQDRGRGAYRLVVRDDGSVVLPPAVREAFGIQGRGAVLARLEGDEFKLISTATAWRRIDERLAPYKWKEGALASDELIADRRAEAARHEDG
ncbi:AbrB/MazE/SpoVT family DNA-binding domain-containing protein [Phenylobacterium sp.]|jgi:ParB-like chromosome segregation protein Spo0J|uniref:AbrB/MazE/SpoVT family DNA-binding domain-containing protein n=1 Tax=Phenylobacterium sp. TaxID=1871053 RepID=UPI002F94BAF6